MSSDRTGHIDAKPGESILFFDSEPSKQTTWDPVSSSHRVLTISGRPLPSEAQLCFAMAAMGDESRPPCPVEEVRRGAP